MNKLAAYEFLLAEHPLWTKEAVTPEFAVRHWDNPAASFHGPSKIKKKIARGYGKLTGNPTKILRLQQMAHEMHQPQAIAYGPAFAKATIVGEAARAGIRHGAKAVGVPESVARRAADWSTYIKRKVPTHLWSGIRQLPRSIRAVI